MFAGRISTTGDRSLRSMVMREEVAGERPPRCYADVPAIASAAGDSDQTGGGEAT